MRCQAATEVSGGYRGGSSGPEHVGRHSMTASQLALWKNAIDCRAVRPSSPAGTTTRCSVLRQWSLVQRARVSPRLTTKASRCGPDRDPRARRARAPPGRPVRSSWREDRERAVVGVGAGSQLAAVRRPPVDRRVAQRPLGAGVAVDERVEVRRRKVEPDGHQREQRDASAPPSCGSSAPTPAVGRQRRRPWFGE